MTSWWRAMRLNFSCARDITKLSARVPCGAPSNAICRMRWPPMSSREEGAPANSWSTPLAIAWRSCPPSAPPRRWSAMYDRKPLWAWVVAGLGRIAPCRNGTVLPFLALKQGRDAAHECSLYSQLLRTTAEGEVVLVMAESKTLSILLADDHTLIGDALVHVFKT